MADKIDLGCTVLVPQVHGENEEGAVNFTVCGAAGQPSVFVKGTARSGVNSREVNLVPGLRVAHDEANARRWSDWPSVLYGRAYVSIPRNRLFTKHNKEPYHLVAETAHARANGLLRNFEAARS